MFPSLNRSSEKNATDFNAYYNFSGWNYEKFQLYNLS